MGLLLYTYYNLCVRFQVFPVQNGLPNKNKTKQNKYYY